jgi:protein gp37
LHEGHSGTAIKGQWTGLLKRNTPGVWEKPLGLRPGTKCFTCSMSDFWHEDVPLDDLAEAIGVIERTPWVIYQILTKRPAMAIRRLAMLGRQLPPNVWVGATIGHPKSLPLLRVLRRIDAPIHFLSVEPLLAPMVPGLDLAGIDWVIGGGESPGRLRARPCDPDWMRALRDLCIAASVPFFLKQWGTWGNNPTPRIEELDPDAQGGATLDGRLWREFPI